jgi:hypothetical protein
MPQRTHYWSCSKFADWLRGTAKPKSATVEDWGAWRRAATQSHRIRYWLAEEVLDEIQNFLWYPLDKVYDLKYYINNRWVTRTHQLTANARHIKPGTWRDVGDRFMPCLFNELVNYVEVELAWWQIAWDKEARAKYRSPFWASGWFRWRTWRCREAGLDNLDWQSNLRWTEDEVGPDSENLGKLTNQAIRAQEILALYRWWTEVYPNRPDPHDASGWTEWCETRRNRRIQNGEDSDISWLSSANDSHEDKAKSSDILDLCSKIEEGYAQEDTEMLIRLIKIRDALWT